MTKYLPGMHVRVSDPKSCFHELLGTVESDDGEYINVLYPGVKYSYAFRSYDLQVVPNWSPACSSAYGRLIREGKVDGETQRA